MAEQEELGEDVKELYISKYHKYLCDLALKAIEKNPFEFICTMLRVSGCEDEGWDTLSSAKETLKDFNKCLQQSYEQKNFRAATRIGLVMYCHLVEMTVGHELIFNTLRCLDGQKYTMWPFKNLIEVRNKNNPKRKKQVIPPSAKKKFGEIKKLSQKLNENEIIKSIDEIFSEEIRNAVCHSDYIVTDEYFRMREGGYPRQIDLQTINELICKCFAFYDAMLFWNNKWLESFAQMPKYLKLPNYEVLELRSENNIVNGFAIHFSNGHKASYSRSKCSELVNIIINGNGTISPTCGRFDLLEKKWKIDNKPSEEYGMDFNSDNCSR
jgi:hypothetical protein